MIKKAAFKAYINVPKWLSLLRALLALSIAAGMFLPPGASAFSLFNGPAKPPEVFDAERQGLIATLAHQPELMNVDYLRYIIGSPQNEAQQQGPGDKHFIWYDRQYKAIYELRQQMSFAGDAVEVSMIVHLHNTGLTFDKLDELYPVPSGQYQQSSEQYQQSSDQYRRFSDQYRRFSDQYQAPPKRFFDQQAHPAEAFSFVPGCTLTFSSEPDTFRLSQAQISYSGVPLPPPDPRQIQMAASARLARAQNFGLGCPDAESLALLQQQVQLEQANAEAHLYLAKAYRQSGNLNGAISEYKAALNLGYDDQNVHNQAQAALVAMHVIDPNNMAQSQNPYPDPYQNTYQNSGSNNRRADLQFYNHGQRLRAHGWQKQNQYQDQYQNQADGQLAAGQGYQLTGPYSAMPPYGNGPVNGYQAPGGALSTEDRDRATGVADIGEPF